MSNKYTKVQMLAYEINTGEMESYTEDKASRLLGMDSKEKDKISGYYNIKGEYKGDNTPSTDIEGRVTILIQAIEKAFEEATKEDKTLKVFMAPEFFFRGTKGAYQIEDADALPSLLITAIKDQKYKDWLFVFGSAVMTFKGHTKNAKVESDENIVQNVVFTCKGGTDATLYAIIKEYMSEIDFIDGSGESKDEVAEDGKFYKITRSAASAEALTRLQVTHLKDAYASGEGKEFGTHGGSVIEIDGITIGVEICLDHFQQRLRKSPPKESQNYIQLQLIPSAGMEIFAKSIVAIKKGLVFNCDSYTGSTVKVVATQCAGSDKDATFEGQSVTAKKVDAHTAGELDNVKKYYAINDKEQTPKIAVYDVKDIPPAVTRKVKEAPKYNV